MGIGVEGVTQMLDDDYDRPPRNPVLYGMISLFCGIVGCGIVFFYSEYYYISIILGAVGMLLGGFSISIANHFPAREKYQYMWFAIVGVMASVICFMFGMVKFAG
jgi:hypothetical protein